MGKKAYDGPNRRHYLRHDMVFPVDVEVDRPGSKPLHLQGTTINLGLGGVIVDLPQTLPIDARCCVHFQHAVGRISPIKPLGRIQDVRSWKRGRHAVAIKFLKPLEMAKPAGEV